jgi:shikimate 5-dehydrogenase
MHSKSPEIHNTAYRLLGIKDVEYTRHEVTPAELSKFISKVKADGSWVGFSVTMPLKSEIFQYCDTHDDIALSTDAINTVSIDGNGVLHGFNTDVYGIEQALLSQKSAPLPHSSVILGSGATARSALYALTNLGAKQILVVSRRRPVWIDQPATLRPSDQGAQCPVVKWVALDDFITKMDNCAELLGEIPTTIVSTLPWDPASTWLPRLAKELPWFTSTRLLECAFPKVLPNSIDGSVMLVHQAVKQLEIWFANESQPSAFSRIGEELIDLLN